MLLNTRQHLRRPGFTLIEVIVAAGLCMLIMSVLTIAFSAGIDTFSLLKSTGELNERLATAQQIILSDLQSPHLESDSGEPVKVSALRFDLLAGGVLDRLTQPQPRGFFRVRQENATTPTTAEGNDPDGVPSSRANNHVLQMMVKLPGNRLDRAFVTKLPDLTALTAAERTGFDGNSLTNLLPLTNTNNRFATRRAEVSYFLSQETRGTTGTLDLFSLHRRVRLVLDNDGSGINWVNPTNRNTTTGANAFPGLSVSPANQLLNGPGDLANPNNRLGGLAATRGASGAVDQIAPLGTGEDILLTNVLSFEVKVNWNDNGVEAPFDNVPVANNTTHPQLANQRIFDTWTTSLTGWDATAAPPVPTNDFRIPSRVRLKAVQIKIRIYDTKNKLTRQITIVQDM